MEPEFDFFQNLEEHIPNYDLLYYTPNLSFTQPPSIEILPPPKEKGQDYYIDCGENDTEVLIKRDKWLNLRVSGEVGLLLEVKTLYDSMQDQQERLYACQECVTKHELSNTKFFVVKQNNEELKCEDGTGHYSMQLTSREPQDLKMKFLCFSSCTLHGKHGKKMKIVISLRDPNNQDDQPIVCEQVYKLLVRAAPKRDIQHFANGKVDYRKPNKKIKELPAEVENAEAQLTNVNSDQAFIYTSIIDSGNLNESQAISLKDNKRKIKVETPTIDSSPLEVYEQRCCNGQEPWISFRMNSSGDQKLITDMIERLGGIIKLQQEVQKFGLRDVI